MKVTQAFLYVLSVYFIVNAVSFAQTPPVAKWTLSFKGNRVFSQSELIAVTDKCLMSDSHWNDTHNPNTLDYCLRKLKFYLASRGYLQGNVDEPHREESEDSIRVVVTIDEGPLYRLGEIEISGSKLFPPAQIRDMVSLKTGDIANGETLNTALYERVKKAYSDFGYIQYTAEVEPKFYLKEGAQEGTVDFNVSIDEGKEFTIRSIKFKGNGVVSEKDLLREMLVRTGEVFNKGLFDDSLRRISQTGQFEIIDVDKDVDYDWDKKHPQLDLTIHLKKKT